MGIWAPNRYEWVVTQFATARIGAILVTINPAYQSAELEYALVKAGVSVLALARGSRGADYTRTLGAVRDRCPELRRTIVFEDDWRGFLAGADQVGSCELEERESTVQFDDPINIQFTSGTTGDPKGVTVSHHNILNNAYFTARTLSYSERDRVCVPVPFYHCFGMVIGNLAAATHGACVVVPSESFDAAAVLAAVEIERCTSLYGVPTMVIAELEELDVRHVDLSSLRTGVVGGAPCPIELMTKVQSRMHMPEVTFACGMTETSPVSTQTARNEPVEKRLGTVGRAHPHLEIKIVDPATGEVVPRGTAGEQCTRGYSVMLGYWDDEEATRAAIDEAGWLHTGDLAVMDDDGYLQIVGRLEDVIIRGGENIYPREIEELLHRLPQVADVYVIGVPSTRYGEDVMAWIKLHEGARLAEHQLVAACRGRIASYKIPRYWKFVESFPMTVTGKARKFLMRQAVIEELGRQTGKEAVAA